MSYILDALKRADADRDRQRAAVPDLHAQSDVYPFREPAASRAPQWWLGGAALGTLVVAGLSWWVFVDRDVPQSTRAPETIAAIPPANLPTGQAPAPPPAPPPPIAVQPPAPAAEEVARPRATASQAVAPPPAPRPGSAAPRPTLPVAAVAPPAPAPLPLYAALPPALRTQIPALSVNGSVYSRTRASRIVILNGQVFREGDRPTDGLVVEEIRLKSSVLSLRGTRFELPH